MDKGKGMDMGKDKVVDMVGQAVVVDMDKGKDTYMDMDTNLGMGMNMDLVVVDMGLVYMGMD